MTRTTRLAVLVLGLISAFLPSTHAVDLSGAGAAAPMLERADVERVAAGIRGTVYIVDWHGAWDFTTIQAALNAAEDGDTVIVLPSAGSPDGAYVENVVFPARAITLRSIYPQEPAIVAATVIDGNTNGPVVHFQPGTPTEAALLGFTITNGTGVLDEGEIMGGGLFLVSASPLIAWNRITGNTAEYGGGGIHARSGTPTIDRNTIIGNTSHFGGGIYLRRYAAPVISNNVIVGNNTLAGGGGLLFAASSPTVVNNTIAGNSGNQGGGVYSYLSSPSIVGNIIAFNACGVYKSHEGEYRLSRNNVYGNAIYEYSNLDDPTGTNGNISADPALRVPPDAGTDGLWGTPDDDYGDLRLLPASPCVDAGSNGYASGDTDLDGFARIVDGDFDGAAVIDIGAYEYLPADMDGDGAVRPADYTLWNACLAGPDFAYPAGCELADLDGDDDVDLRDFALFGRMHR